MSKKSANNVEQDEILKAFKDKKEEITGEQLDLLDGIEEQEAPVPEKKIKIVKDDHILPEEEVVPQEEAEVEEEKCYIGYDGVQYSEFEWVNPVVRKGPTRKEIEGWKERHDGQVFYVPFNGEPYVFRALNRPEYREIIRDTTLTALDREELFTERCILFPYDFNLEKIKKSRAGLASLLSEMIMEKSGFVSETAPIKL